MNCRLCGSDRSEPWHQRGAYALRLCSTCHNAWLPDDQLPENLAEMYSREYFEGTGDQGYGDYLGDADVMARNCRRRLAWIERLTPSGRLLDVGAAYGYLLGEARQRGWECEGVEIAADVAQAAAQRTGIPITAGDFLAADLRPGYQVVSFFDVLEHMPDPSACLARARELLAPDGWVVVETGDRTSAVARLLGANWYFIDPPQHLAYFSAAGLETSLRTAGFAGPIRKTLPSKSLSFANIIHKVSVLAPWEPARRMAARVSRRRVSGSIRLNAFDNMLVAAQAGSAT